MSCSFTCFLINSKGRTLHPTRMVTASPVCSPQLARSSSVGGRAASGHRAFAAGSCANMGACTVGGPDGRRRAVLPALPLLAAALLLTSTAHAVLFTLRCGGRAKCITQDLRGPAVSVARYRVADGGDGVAPQRHKIRVRVRDPKGKSIRRVESMESGEFAFLAGKNGRYSACFWSPRLMNSSAASAISIKFEWSTGNATHYSRHPNARKVMMQAQMPGAEASKQSYAPANNYMGGAKAFESAEDRQLAASGAEGEADDDDDNEDGGGKKGDNKD